MTDSIESVQYAKVSVLLKNNEKYAFQESYLSIILKTALLSTINNTIFEKYWKNQIHNTHSIEKTKQKLDSIR